MSVVTFGKRKRVGFPLAVEYGLTRTPIYVIGAPNMGKSTLLGNLAEQFCAQDEGVLLLDIKGDLAREVASRTRHPERVVYVKMGEVEFPGADRRYWTLNPFDGHRSSDAVRQQIRTQVLESFERLNLAKLDQMANIRATLRTAINIALSLPEPTYIDLLLIVVEESYRQYLLETQKHIDHITRRHWQDLDNRAVTNPFARRSEINTARNRLETLLDSPHFNLAVGRYRSTLRLTEWLDAGKMILVDLGLPLERQTGIDLGNLLMAHLVAQSYVRPVESRKRTWRVVVDEFHEFVGLQFADIINDLRSFNVFPVMAHQNRGQLTTDEYGQNPLLSAVGQAEITLLLRPSVEDRKALTALYQPEEAQAIAELKPCHALMAYYASLRGSYVRDPVALNNWWDDPVPGQLARLQMAAHIHTVAREELVESNRKRYWDILDGTAIHGTRNSNASTPRRKPKTKADPPAEIRPRPAASQASQSGNAARAPQDNPRPGVARPPRIIDQRDDSGSFIPRPPRPKPNPEE